MNTKAHTRYRTKSGIIVPGTTTFLGLLAKPALVWWAWNLGMKGEDYRKVRDKAASIGTITHYLVECSVKGVKPDLDDYPPRLVKVARHAFSGFEEWRDTNKAETVACEVELVSEEHLYGGKLDWVTVLRAVSGKLVLADIKTSKAIYAEHIYQLAAYWNLWNENHPKTPIDEALIIHLNKETGNTSFHPYKTWLDREFKICMHLRAVYALQKMRDPNRDKDRAYRKAVKSQADEEKS